MAEANRLAKDMVHRAIAAEGAPRCHVSRGRFQAAESTDNLWALVTVVPRLDLEPSERYSNDENVVELAVRCYVPGLCLVCEEVV